MRNVWSVGLLAVLVGCGGQTVSARSGATDAAVGAEAADGFEVEAAIATPEARPDAGLDDALVARVDAASQDLVSQEDGALVGDLPAPADERATEVDVVAADAPSDAPRCSVTELGSALGDGVARGSTVDAMNLRRGGCGGESGPEVALRWTAPRAGTYTFTTSGSDFDTLLYLRGACDGADRVCNDDVVPGTVRSSTATLTLAAGEPLFVFIDGWEDSAGNYVLNIAEGGPVRCTPGRTRSCYGGPPGTEGVGRCAAVTQTCLSQGVWPDLCRGDLRPAEFEVCGNRVDDDCDGATDEDCDAVGTRVLAGRVTYERRVPNATRSDWTSAPDAPAPGFAVYSFRGERMIDAAVSSTEAMREGAFSLRVPDPPGAEDRVVVAALHRDARGVIRYAVANPALAAGTYAPHTGSDQARVWSWSWRSDLVPPDGTLRITRAQGSGAAVTFEHLARAVRVAESRYARNGLSLLAWQGEDVSWSCGACFSVSGTQRFGQGFSSQISMFGSAQDESYWSPGTITHEAGHWAMTSFGVSPREGGTHYLNTPESPGLAWSEGWATWYGAALRNDPVIVSKQRGFMYWFDIAARRLSSGRAWSRPSASAGLSQPIAENEVSAVLWALAPAPRDALYTALGSNRMTRAPFLRGYRNPQGVNVPYLPDFLDALRCAGMAPDVVTAASRPYPYDASMPLCRSMDEAPPLTVDWTREVVPDVTRTSASQGLLHRITAVFTPGVTLDARVAVRFVLPPGMHLVQGEAEGALDPLRPNVIQRRAVTVRFEGTPTAALRVEAAVELDDFGLHGAASLPFGPAPVPARSAVVGAPLRVLGADLGASVDMTR